MSKRVSQKTLDQQLRAVFGRGARFAFASPAHGNGGPSILVRFVGRRGETIDMVKTRLAERLNQLPACDE